MFARTLAAFLLFIPIILCYPSGMIDVNATKVCSVMNAKVDNMTRKSQSEIQVKPAPQKGQYYTK